MVPLVGGYTPAIMLDMVDLPEPFSPTNPSTLPARTCKVTSVTALVAPNSLNICSAFKTISSNFIPPHCFYFVPEGGVPADLIQIFAIRSDYFLIPVEGIFPAAR